MSLVLKMNVRMCSQGERNIDEMLIKRSSSTSRPILQLKHIVACLTVLEYDRGPSIAAKCGDFAIWGARYMDTACCVPGHGVYIAS